MMTIVSQLAAISIHAHQLDLERQEAMDAHRTLIAERLLREAKKKAARNASKESDVLRVMQGAGSMTTMEIASLIGRGRMQTYRCLRDLESRNLILRTGNQATTKWKIAEAAGAAGQPATTRARRERPPLNAD